MQSVTHLDWFHGSFIMAVMWGVGLARDPKKCVRKAAMKSVREVLKRPLLSGWGTVVCELRTVLRTVHWDVGLRSALYRFLLVLQ